MAVLIKEFSGRKLIFGLDWNTLQGVKKDAEEIKDLAKETKVKFYAKSKGKGSDALVGLPVGAPEGAIKGKVYSAAQAFASMEGVEDNAVIIWNFEDGDSAWVCVVRNGFPVLGKDIITDQSQAESIARNELSFSEEPMAVYGNSTELKAKAKLNIDDIAYSCGKDDEMRRVGGAVSLGMVIGGVVVLFAAGYGYYLYAEQQRIERERLAAQAAQQVDPNIAYGDSLKRLDHGTPASLTWQGLKAIIDPLTPYAGGWKLTTVNCDAVAARACELTWTRINGSNQDFIANMNLPQGANWSMDASKLTYSLPLSADQAGRKVSLDVLPAMKDFLVNFVSQIQDASLFGLGISIKNLTPYGLPPGVSFSQIRPENLVSSGEWEMSGDYWMAEYAGELPENFTIKSMVVNLSETTTKFNMKGVYYAKN